MKKVINSLLLAFVTLFATEAMADQSVMEISAFHEGLAVFQFSQGNKLHCGYIDKSGNVAIKPKFGLCYDFHEGLAAVSVRGKAGYIDKSGKFVIKPQFDTANEFSNGLASVVISGHLGGTGTDAPEYAMIYRNGKTAFSLVRGIVIKGDFCNGVVAFSQNEKIGFLSVSMKSGRVTDVHVAIQPKLDSVQDGESFREDGVAAAEVNSKWGFISLDGKWAIYPQAELAGDFSEGLACVEINGRYGYIRTDGKFAIKPQFETCSDFHNGIASGVMKFGKRGVIDRYGNWVIQPQFEYMDDFDSSGRALFRVKDLSLPSSIDKFGFTKEHYLAGFVDKQGNIVVQPRFVDDGMMSEGLVSVNLYGDFGFIDSTGNWVISPDTLRNSLSRYCEKKPCNIRSL